MPSLGGGRWAQAFSDEDEYRRWHRNLARGSVATADDYRRKLARYLHEIGHTPASFAKLTAKECYNLLSDHIDDLMSKPSAQTGRPVAGSGCAVIKKAVVSWLAWNELKLPKDLKIPNVSHRPRLRGIQVPIQSHLASVLAAADPRSRAALALIAMSGVREQVMGDYLGEEGLRIRHLADAEIKDGRVVFNRTPCRILVPETLSKTDHAWFTFLGPEGCSYLEAYFRKRAERGEILTRDSAVIRSTRSDQQFMRTPSIYRLLRAPMLAAGVKAMPYIWRSYFDTRAMLAETKGLIRDYRQFFMGHTGDIEHVYTLHKDLSPEVIEAMREGYELTLPLLETRAQVETQSPMLRLTESLLKAAGHDSKKTSDLDLSQMDESALVNLLTEEVARRVQALSGTPAPIPALPLAIAPSVVPVPPVSAPSTSTPENASSPQPKMRQLIVEIGHLGDFLQQGWFFRTSLDGGKALVELAT